MEGQGRIQDFKLGGAHLNKLHRAAGGAKIVGVFRVKNHDFYAKKSYFFQFKGVQPPTTSPPPPDPPLKVVIRLFDAGEMTYHHCLLLSFL